MVSRPHTSATRRSRRRASAFVAAFFPPTLVAVAAGPSTASASTPAGFSDSVVFSGLDAPTAIRFSPDGRVFVAEQSGLIKVYDSLRDKTPTVFADLRTQVYN